MLQAYDSKPSSRAYINPEKDKIFVLGSNKEKKDSKKIKQGSNKMICSYHKRSGHVQAYCYSRKHEQKNGSGHKDETDNALVAMLEHSKENWVLAAWHTAYLDPGATAHMVKGNVIISDGKGPTNATIGTVIANVAEATSQVSSKVRLSDGTKTVRLDRVVLAAKVTHNLVSVSGLRDEDHAELFTKTDSIVKERTPLLALVSAQVECTLLNYILMLKTLFATEGREETLNYGI